jgi:hypothetical protein
VYANMPLNRRSSGAVATTFTIRQASGTIAATNGFKYDRSWLGRFCLRGVVKGTHFEPHDKRRRPGRLLSKHIEAGAVRTSQSRRAWAHLFELGHPTLLEALAHNGKAHSTVTF